MWHIYHDLSSFDNMILALESAVTIKKQVYKESHEEVAKQFLLDNNNSKITITI